MPRHDRRRPRGATRRRPPAADGPELRQLPGNGDAARASITAVAAHRGEELAGYVARCTFPNSMVDRITPHTKDGDRAWLRDEVRLEDGWPVVCEPFRQWVIEDAFVAGRPAWDEVGVLFTERVDDWELYKLRMLNASHSCMAYLGALAGIVHVDEVIAVAPMRRYLERLLATEAIPTLRRSRVIRLRPTLRRCCSGSRTPASATRSRGSASTAPRSSRAS